MGGEKIKEQCSVQPYAVLPRVHFFKQRAKTDAKDKTRRQQIKKEKSHKNLQGETLSGASASPKGFPLVGKENKDHKFKITYKYDNPVIILLNFINTSAPGRQ